MSKPTLDMAIGADAQGVLPLPWLDAPLAQADALANSHALLVHGQAGAGQLELALAIAQAVLCEGRAAGSALRPCGRCASCHLVRGRSHPDLLLVLPEALRVQLGWIGDDETKLTKADAKPSRDLKIEQLRHAIAWTQQTNARGRGKLLLLHPADALNTVSANALLKTLEEPPGGLRIVLTSVDPERLLPTLRSRCQRLPLALPPHDLAAHWLAAQGVAVADADALLAATGGSPLQALAWARDGIAADWLDGLPARVAQGDGAPLSGRPLPLVIDLLLKLAHDAMALAAGGSARFFASARWPEGAELPALVAWQQALLRAARHDDHPWNAGLLLESLVGQAAAAWPHAAPARQSARR
jgi:DNA polymerase-3 subunit delta'